MLNCLENTLKICDSCQIFDLINLQSSLTWPNSNTAGISLNSRLKYSKITHRYAKKLSIHFVLVLKTSHCYRFYLSISPPVALMPENVFMGQFQLSKACWELWLSDDQPHSDYNGQWQRALCMLAVLQSSQPNPQRNEKRKMYALKQIKICAEYRDMLPRPRLVCQEPGLRPSWICQVHRGFGLSASAQIPDKPALAWVACPGILHRS